LKEIPEVFDPRAPRYRGKLWVRLDSPEAGASYHVFWFRVAAALAVLVLAGWLLVTAAAWAFVRHTRGYTEARYLDLALFPLPARAAHFRAGLGRHYLATGVLAMTRQDPAEGYPLLLAGLAHLPADLTARRTVAIHEIRLGLPHRALRTLESGAPYAIGDLDYLKVVFALMLENQEDDRAIALAGTLLPPQPDAVLAHRFVALQAATAHFHRGRYAAAERLLADWSLAQSLEGAILQARCDWERGYPELALVRLEGELPRFPRRDELYLELIGLHRKLGHYDEARRMALLRHLRDPAGPGPRISLIQSYHASGETAAELREQEIFLHEFRSDPRALTLLAWHAVDTLQPALMERVYAVAREMDHPRRAFHLARIELLLASQDYTRARTIATAALAGSFEPEDNLPLHLRALRALAVVALGDTVEGELELRAFRTTVRWRPGDLLHLARHLRLLGLPGLAREFVDHAVKFDSRNEMALAELVRLDAIAKNQDALAENLPRLLRFGKPPRAVLEEALLLLDPQTQASLRADVLSTLRRLPEPDHAL
jgi:hypothetical protein